MSSHRGRFLAAFAILILTIAPALYADATFTPLPLIDKVPVDASADAAIILGDALFGGAPFLWTEAGGIEFLPAGSLAVHSISPDGTIVAGDTPDTEGFTTAALWTEAGGWKSLGSFENAVPVDNNLSHGWDVSADGSVATGLGWDLSANPIAVGFLWTEATGMVSMGSSGNASRGTGISADGLVVAGFDEHPSFGHRRPAKWTALDGWVLLTSNPDDVAGEAIAINSDGSVITGVSTNLATFNPEAFLWTEGKGLVNLGVLDPTMFLPRSDGIAVSEDGAVVVGWSGSFFGGGFEAFIWTEAGGMRPLAEVLIEQGATGLDDWTLTQATAISSDGTTIVGYGFNPSQQIQTFIATLDGGGGGEGPKVFGRLLGLEQTAAVSCSDPLTGSVVTMHLNGTSLFDCTAAGLETDFGNRIELTVRGTVSSDGRIGGKLRDVVLGNVHCLNNTTGAQGRFRLETSTSWDCDDADIELAAGDELIQRLFGVVQ